MPTLQEIFSQINELVKKLIEIGLSVDQNFPAQRPGPNDYRIITFPAANCITIALKDYTYTEIYQYLINERAYLVKMIDGAIIQIMYSFKGHQLVSHRLAFFPSPDLEEFQNNPDIYLLDEMYADITDKNIVTFPLRFDFCSKPNEYVELYHPMSHLTLGQYNRCRIPVTAPVTPFWFIDFILRNFYNTAFEKYADKLPKYFNTFEESISNNERDIIHLSIPKHK